MNLSDLKNEMSQDDLDQFDANDQLYILFSLASDQYAVSLLDVSEIIEIPKFKHIPNTYEYFLGFFNLRGEIVGLIDFRLKLNYPGEERPSVCCLVFETNDRKMAAVVDKVNKVVRVDPSQIDVKPKVNSKIPMSFLKGIAMLDENLFPIIALRELVSREEILKIKVSAAKGDIKLDAEAIPPR